MATRNRHDYRSDGFLLHLDSEKLEFMGFNPPSPVATAKQLLSQRKASCTLTALGDDADDELDGAGQGWAISRPEMTLRLPTTNTVPPKRWWGGRGAFTNYQILHQLTRLALQTVVLQFRTSFQQARSPLTRFPGQAIRISLRGRDRLINSLSLKCRAGDSLMNSCYKQTHRRVMWDHHQPGI